VRYSLLFQLPSLGQNVFEEMREDMHALRNRIVMIIGFMIVITGDALNYFSRKYQGLYRSLQHRNLKLEESLMSADMKRIMLFIIGLGVLGVLGHFLVKHRSRMKEKGIAIAGILLFGGQALSTLSGQTSEKMGLYVSFLGYLIALIGFILALYEVKEQTKNEV
jgi:uncharacterized membrane protein